MAQVVARTGELHEVLADALRREIGMDADDAREIAGFVLGAFNGREELDDMELSPDLRSIFYTLEGHRFLSFRREEFTNEDGELRRAFFWHFRWDQVAGSAQDASARDLSTDSVYDSLPRSAWRRFAGA